MKCAPCLLASPVTETKDLVLVPDAVTQISGTLVCLSCARTVNQARGLTRSDPVLQAQRELERPGAARRRRIEP